MKFSLHNFQNPTILLLLIYLHHTAAEEGVFYGSKCFSDPNIADREKNADVVLSGRIKAIHRGYSNATYQSSVLIYRIIKGESTVSSLLSLPADTRNYYRRTIDVSGFGNSQICDSDVTHGDVRIFLLSYSRESNLTLNSSLVRIGIRTLKINLKSTSDEPMKDAKPMLSECKFFYCSFYAECKLGFLSKQPYCECPSCENEIPEQVCGSDGKWYRNVCETRKASCIRRRRIKPAHPIRCQATERPTPSTKRPIIPETTPRTQTTTASTTVRVTTPTTIPNTPPATTTSPTTTPTPSPTSTALTTPTTTKSSTTAKTTTDKKREETTVNLIDTTTVIAVDSLRDPCLDENCEFGAMCIRSMDGLEAMCICPITDEECEDWYGFGDSDLDMPVCGTDGTDYDNECQMRKYACNNFETVKVAKFGKCKPCEGFVCPAGQRCVVGEFNKAMCECNTECPSDGVPVCGTDGRDYDNECLLLYTQCIQRNLSLSVAYIGQCKFKTNPCQDTGCSNYATCKVTDEGTATCQCPSNCSPASSEVCGTDGVTYRNLCTLQRAACVQQKNITVAGEQPCEENTCLNYDCPYGGQCEILYSTNSTLPTPSCVCPVCSSVIKPACGDNGKTYGNECELRRESCTTEQDIKISHQGSCDTCEDTKCEFGVCHNRDGRAVCLCPEDACVDSYSPVCADNGTSTTTFRNMCELTVMQCKLMKKMRIVSEGPCDGNQCEREQPCLYRGICVGESCLCNWQCEESEDFVCGDNGKTYSNPCALNKDSCRTQSLVSVAYRGECGDRLSGSGDDDGTGDDVTDDGQSGQNGNQFDTTTMFNDDYCNMDTNCRYDGQCDYAGGPPGVCVCTGFFDFCEDSDDTPPSCGSDGVLYNNICELRETQCKTQREISPRSLEFCAEETTPMSTSTPLCYDSQMPLVDTSNSYINCSSCLPNQVGQCDLCPSDSYCANSANCCPKDMNVPECTYTEFGCCRDNKTLASPGPDHRGCPYTCECHPIGANSNICDPLSFQCDCKLGVVGRTCERCKLGWWGLRLIDSQNNAGCLPCQCNALGSVRADCQQDTGRCLCREGVFGLKCDRCPEDGMILTSDGCVFPDDEPTDKEEEETCDTKDCGNGQCIRDSDDRALCTCDYECDDKVDYICGSDGQTYTNICHLRRKACVDGGLMEVMRGQCQPDTTPDLVESTVASKPTTTKPTTPKGTFWGGWFGGSLADEPSREVEVIPGSDVPSTSDLIAQVTCADNPCNNGASCEDNTKLGFVCVCSVFWKGRKCSEVNEFTVPSFHGNSFIKLVGWEHPLDSFDLRLTIIPTNDTGIILYGGKQSGRGDFMSLVLNAGHLEFRFDTGGGAVSLRTRDKLIINRKYTVRVERTGRSGQLGVEGHDPVYNEAPGSHTGLNIDPELLVGHVLTDQMEKIPKRVLRNLGYVSQGLIGCISMIHDAETNVNFELTNSKQSLIFVGRNIGECDSNPCMKEPCINGGLCRMVNTFNYECDCRNGFTGTNCDLKPKSTRDLVIRGRRLRVKYEEMNPNVVEVPRFSGASYMEYRLRREVEYNMSVSIIFNTKQADGVLLYGSQNSDGSGDFILLSFESYKPILRFDLGSGITTLRLDDDIRPKKWNFVEFSKVGQRAQLSLNGNTPVTLKSQGEMKYLNIQDHVKIGAIPADVIHNEEYLHTAGLHGVIQWFSINGDDVSDMFHAANVLYDIKRYHGPPCHPNPCLVNHVCKPVLDGYRCDPL